jgi:transposase
MTQRDDSRIIRIVHPICCGLDVHKESVSACVIFPNDKGEEQCDVKVFGTFTDDLTRLRNWLAMHNCPVVAMESTGVYWRPVHNVLEDSVQVVLVNARDMHNVPGRKTDIGDSRWIAGLLRHGLLKSSFIPPQDVRHWRDLTRLRKKYVHTVGDYRKRTHKLFESANIKIDSVVSDLFGVTGRNLMQLLVADRELTLSAIRTCVRGKLKGKEAELFRSIQGFFTAPVRLEDASFDDRHAGGSD